MNQTKNNPCLEFWSLEFEYYLELGACDLVLVPINLNLSNLMIIYLMDI